MHTDIEVERIGQATVGRRTQELHDPFRRLSALHVHSGNLFGGIERALLTCIQNQHFAPQLRFEFALCFDGKFRHELLSAGQIVHPVPEVHARNPISVMRARGQLSRMLGTGQYDVIMCHSPWAHSVFAPVIQRSGIPELFWAHDHFRGKHWSERWARRTAPDFVVCNGRYSEQSLDRLFPGIQRQVVRCPVAMERLFLSAAERRQVRGSLGTSDESVVIIQVSRMEALKGHELLLEAVSKMPSETPWHLWFVGGPQRREEAVYQEYLKARAQQLAISDRVVFVGQRSDVSRLLATADIFCQANRSADSFGLAFVEGLSQGLPVVAFDMGGPAEIVDDSCGILVPPGNTTALAAELERLVRDAKLRRMLGDAGPARARELCNPSVVMPQLQHVIAGLCSKMPAV